jgi:hypothetical protein
MHRNLVAAVLILFGFFIVMQPAAAAEGTIYPTYGPRTINLGKQGLFLSNPPLNTTFVEVKKLAPPLRPKFTDGVQITYRGPALEIKFLNKDLLVVSPGATLSSVYFNIAEPELRMWEEMGSEEIAIWYYNISADRWQMCPTRLVEEKKDNGKYDRLACIVMGNGIYVLGKMKIDKTFPELFRPHNLAERTRVDYD